jgi:hypothetical protein
LLVANQKGLSANNLPKQFEILSYSDAEMDPIDFNKSPSLAIQIALKKAQISLEDVDFFEINEVKSNLRHFQLLLLRILRFWGWMKVRLMLMEVLCRLVILLGCLVRGLFCHCLMCCLRGEVRLELLGFVMGEEELQPL